MTDAHKPDPEDVPEGAPSPVSESEQPAKDILVAGPHSRAELNELATSLMRVTGMRRSKPNVQLLSMILCWCGAGFGGLCGLSLSLDGSLVWFLERDVQVVSFVVSLMLSMAFPLAFGVMMGQALNRWATGLKDREVVLSLATVPGMGAIAAHGIKMAWLNAMVRYILPFLILALGVVIWVVVATQMGGGGPRIRRMEGLFFFVSSLTIFAAAPLVTGASYASRLLVFFTAVIPVMAPVWIQIWLSLTSQILGMSTDQQMISIYLVLLACHLTCAMTILIHVAAGASDWARRLRTMAERT